MASLNVEVEIKQGEARRSRKCGWKSLRRKRGWGALHFPCVIKGRKKGELD
jgi:hypothetical protein